MNSGIPSVFYQDLDAIISNDRELLKHSYSVGGISKNIFLCLSDEEKQKFNGVTASDIELAGRYHDIGKTFINVFYPNLLKKEHWGDLDRVIIREHVLVGSCILYILAAQDEIDVESPAFALIHDACLYHHERLDGTGYLRVKQIPLIGQLVGVADCYAAGTEKRVYKDGNTPLSLIGELEEMSLNQTYVNALEKSL